MKELIPLLQEHLLANDSDDIVSSCNCITMTPDISYHKKGCKYRLITERDQWRAVAEKLAIRVDLASCVRDGDSHRKDEAVLREFNQLVATNP